MLAHEVSHVANGDMVTLALVQGVVNTFVIFLSRVVGFVVDRALSGNRDDEGGVGIGYFVTSLICEILFGFLASMIVMWFSRRREFRADAGGAHLAGRNRMIAALERLRQMHEPSHLPSQMAAFGINGGTVQRLTGNVFRVIVRNGIGGSTVADFDSQLSGRTGYTDAFGNVWTIT